MSSQEVLQIVGLEGAVGIDKTPAVEHEQEAAEEASPRAPSGRPVWLMVETGDGRGGRGKRTKVCGTTVDGSGKA